MFIAPIQVQMLLAVAAPPCWTVCGIGKVQSIFISGQLKVILLFRYSIILSFHIPCFTISHLCTIYRAGGCLAVCSTNYQPCHYHTTKYCVPNFLTCNCNVATLSMYEGTPIVSRGHTPFHKRARVRVSVFQSCNLIGWVRVY